MRAVRMCTQWRAPVPRGPPNGAMPRACTIFAAEKEARAALEAIQALGGNGYTNDYAAGRLLRDAKLYEIGAGTQEIRRMLIGRELFEGPAETPPREHRIQSAPEGAGVPQGGRGHRWPDPGSQPARRRSPAAGDG